MRTLRRNLFFFLLASAITVVATAAISVASAATDAQRMSARIAMDGGPLDPQVPADTRAVLLQLASASEAACKRMDSPPSTQPGLTLLQCEQQSIEAAVSRIGSARLTALFNAVTASRQTTPGHRDWR